MYSLQCSALCGKGGRYILDSERCSILMQDLAIPLHFTMQNVNKLNCNITQKQMATSPNVNNIMKCKAKSSVVYPINIACIGINIVLEVHFFKIIEKQININ